jgi:serine-type D-Ala-D-Ala endopeptidase (penicillin-binding protein 7)
MFKPALGIMFSLLAATFVAPSAVAAETTETSAVAKAPAAKKSGHAKRKTKKISKKHHSVQRADDGTASVSHQKMVKKVVHVHGRRKVVYQRISAAPVAFAPPAISSVGDQAGLNLTRDPLALKSNVALVMDQLNSEVLFEKNSKVALPIASITKLMTGLIVVEAQQNMDELLEVTTDDIDKEKNSSSRLRIGAQLTRANMLHIALMSSENRAASALGRNYPGGLPAFVAAMNAKAKALGMSDTHYVDSNGLSSRNVASARDLAKLVVAAYTHPILREYSTDTKYVVDTGGHMLQYANTNHLVANPEWEIGLQKTGYISEAGRCLVMQAKIAGRAVVMVFLDSKGKQSRLADAGRIRKWLAGSTPQALVPNRTAVPQG